MLLARRAVLTRVYRTQLTNFLQFLIALVLSSNHVLLIVICRSYIFNWSPAPQQHLPSTRRFGGLACPFSSGLVCRISIRGIKPSAWAWDMRVKTPGDAQHPTSPVPSRRQEPVVNSLLMVHDG